MIEITQQGPVRVLRFARPEARNAIDEATAQALVEALAEAKREESCCCVVLASAHPTVFLSGGDLRELRVLLDMPDAAEQISARGVELGALERCPLPIIAAVQGATYGGGCELLMMCDVIVMETQATLRFVHGKMGLTPAWGGTTRLLERVGSGNAAELLLTAGEVSAEHALRIGLAQRLCGPGEGLQEAVALGQRMARLGRASLASLKGSLVAVKQARRGAALAAGREAFERAFAEGRVQEAVAAFFRK